MKSVKLILLFQIIVCFSINVYSQLWKQYSDSAKSFSDQKKPDKAIEFYEKAKEELRKDSAETNSYALICFSLANLYKNIGQYKKAEPLFVEAKQIREKVLGKEHPDYAASCNGLAILYRRMGQYEKAEPLYLEAKEIRDKVLGKVHPDYASSCKSLAILYEDMGQYKKAEPLYIEAKQIREKILGKEHPQYAESCDDLAIFYSIIGQYEKAEPLQIEAKQISEKKLGKEHPDYARTCDNLAILYNRMHQYTKAEPLHVEAKNIREKALGKEHPDYASSCNNLAYLYYKMGQYEKAEPMYAETKQIRRKTLGKEHPDYASICNNLALLYGDMGQYEKAEPLHVEAKNIREKALGKEHPHYAESCANLAILYSQMGQYEKAKPLFIEAKNVMEKIFGKEHPDYAQCCNNLASLYGDMGQFEKAEPLHVEAKQIREKALGKEHPYYATSCENLASIYKYMGQYEKAEPLYVEAKQIREKKLSKAHPEYARSCDNLASLYKDMGQYKKAEPLYIEAKQIREKALGKEHPEYAESCIDLGNLYWNLNKPEMANNFYGESFESQNIQVKKIFLFTNEVEQQLYLKKIADTEKYFLSFNASGYSHSHQGITYNVSLSSRSLILSSSQELRNVIYNTSDTGVKNKYNIWINSKEQISFWHTKTIDDRPVYVKDLEEQANVLEKELTRLSSAFKNEQQKKEVNWKSIQQSLKTNEAAIELVEFNYFDGKRWTDSTYYIALVLRKNKPEPELVQLFEKKQLDTLLNGTENLDTENRINTLYAGSQSLYNLTWKPLEKYLNGISTVYFASAGNLFKISFAALPVNDKQVLADKYQLIQLNTTATITDNKQIFLTASDKLQLYGGVQYNADSAALKDAVKQYQSGNENARSLPGDITRSDSWNYLPGTEKEASGIEKLGSQKNFAIHFSSGITATEESVKALNGNASPSVLHIATHGFFFPDPKDDKRDSLQHKSESSGRAFKQSDNPLFRSGLLFAGANNAWQGTPIEGIEDGILTAYEVSSMYLPNTKLVVLSACETALGDIQGSEGVYGLQRAFKMAGVQNLVMSLWKIGDRETAEFMQLFYKNLFDKQSVNDAFYNAQTIMKNKYRNEPYKWAAWVLVK